MVHEFSDPIESITSAVLQLFVRKVNFITEVDIMCLEFMKGSRQPSDEKIKMSNDSRLAKAINGLSR